MRTNILHIINGYWSRDLYSFLISKLAVKNIFQTIFVPVRKKEDIGKFEIKKTNIEFLYAFIIKSVVYRIIFWLKIKKSVNFIEKNTDLSRFSLSHSHTLFSDGAVSYYFYRKYGIKYLTTVRNTDLNIYFKYLIHLRKLGMKILLNSERIIFLSESYKIKVLERFSKKVYYEKLQRKSIVIPNGIDDFWHLNSNSKINIKNKDDIFSFIFVGEFNKNKNIYSIIKVIEELRKRGYNCNFKAIGLGFKDDKGYVETLMKEKNDKDYIEFVGALKKEELIEYYKKADIFIMPSYTESFGLVYAEALTQGLPVIYTENEGFDYNFKQGFIGYSVNSRSLEDITKKCEMLILNYNEIQKNCISASKKFKWSEISEIFFNLYNEII